MMPAQMRVVRKQPVVSRPARPAAAHMPSLSVDPTPEPAAAPVEKPADEFDDFMSSMKELGAMFKKLDTNQDGFLSFDEMVAAARGLPPAGAAAPDEPPDEIDEEGYF